MDLVIKRLSVGALFLFFNLQLLSGEHGLRLVSLSPSITEIIVDLGRGSWIVGVTNYDTEPLPSTVVRVGGWVDPSFERIVSLNPNLVLIVRDQEQFIGQGLLELNINYLSLPARTINDIFVSIEKLGNILRCSNNAKRLLDSLKSIVEYAPKFMINGVFVIDHTPGTLNNLYVTGSDTYLDELMKLAGIKNSFGMKSGYFSISVEELIEKDPEIIIELVQSKDSVETPWYKVNQIRAVRMGSVFKVETEIFSHPSSRFPKALKRLKGIVKNVLYKN